MINIVKAKDPVLDEFCARPAFPEQAEKAARDILADVKKNGDAAVRKYAAKFDGFAGESLREQVNMVKLVKVNYLTMELN